MIEVMPGIFLGDDAAVGLFRRQHPEGAIVHAAKEPWHRNYLGYTGRGAPKDHPEYLVAEDIDSHELYLNLVDASKPEYIPHECFDAALEFIVKHQSAAPVLIHCNQGKSRSVGIYIYYRFMTDKYPMEDYEDYITALEAVGYETALGSGVQGALDEWLN